MTIPPYRRDTFLPRGGGFHFAEPTPDLLDDALLAAEDPEDLAAAVLARAQRGDLAATARLLPRMKTCDDGSFWVDCAALLAYAAPTRVLSDLGMLYFEVDGASQEWVASTLCTSGVLFLVRNALATFAARGGNERLFSTPGHLSMILEAAPGEVFEGPALLPRAADDPPWYDPPPRYDVGAYERVVERRLTGLSTAHGWQTAFFEGEPRSLPSIAQRAWERVHRGEDVEEVCRARMVLEASTGVSLAAMYEDGLLRRDRALDALGRLIERGELERYRDGARYFFGREITD